MFVQAGGHQLIKVVNDGQCIVKPTKNKELKFYQEKLAICPELIQFVPKFFEGGRIEKIKDLFTNEEYDVITKKSYKRFIKTENLLDTAFVDTNVEDFCIIDIKLGKIHWKSCASDDNIKECQQRNAGSIMNEYGIRLDGFVKVTNPSFDIEHNSNTIRYTKEECRVMSIDNVRDVLSILSTIDKKYVSDWISNLYNVMKSSNINMYGPSILILKNLSKNKIRVKLIDFTTYEKCVVDKQFDFTKNSIQKKQKKEDKRMRKFLVRYNKLDLLQNMHSDMLFSLESMMKLLETNKEDESSKE